MPQWFVDITDMARRSVEAVKTGELKILPSFHEKTWYQVSIRARVCVLDMRSSRV